MESVNSTCVGRQHLKHGYFYACQDFFLAFLAYDTAITRLGVG